MAAATMSALDSLPSEEAAASFSSPLDHAPRETLVVIESGKEVGKDTLDDGMTEPLQQTPPPPTLTSLRDGEEVVYVGETNRFRQPHGFGMLSRELDSEFVEYFEGKLNNNMMAAGVFFYRRRREDEADEEALEGLEDNVPGKRARMQLEGDVYEGTFAGNLPDGKGRLRFMNGDVYEGEFTMGAVTGEGRYLFASTGDVLLGSFVNGILVRGVRRTNAGEVFVGEFSEAGGGVLHGRGSVRFANGDTYHGGFRHGRFFGLGTYRFAHDGGTLTCGGWRDGELDGTVEVGAGSEGGGFGARCVANYVAGRSDGNCTLWYAKDACVESGELHLDRPDYANLMDPRRGVAVVRQIPLAPSTAASTLDPIANAKAVGAASLFRRILPSLEVTGGHHNGQVTPALHREPAVMLAVGLRGGGRALLSSSSLLEIINGVLASSSTVKFLPIVVPPLVEEALLSSSSSSSTESNWLDTALTCFRDGDVFPDDDVARTKYFLRGLVVLEAGEIPRDWNARFPKSSSVFTVRVGPVRGRDVKTGGALNVEWGYEATRASAKVRGVASRPPELIQTELVFTGLITDLAKWMDATRREGSTTTTIVCEVHVSSFPFDVGAWVVAQVAGRARRADDARSLSSPRMLVVAVMPADETEMETVNGHVHEMLIELA